MSLERAPGKLPAGHWGLGGLTGLGGGAGCWRGVVASLGCCSSLPGDTCLSDIPWGGQAGEQNLEVLREPSREWPSQAGTVCQAGKPERGSWNGCQILWGIPGGHQQGCVWGPGRVQEGHTPSASRSLSHSLGFFYWGHRNLGIPGAGRLKGQVPCLLPLPGKEPLVLGRSPWLCQALGRERGT